MSCLEIDIKATDETAGIRVRRTEALEIPADKKASVQKYKTKPR